MREITVGDVEWSIEVEPKTDVQPEDDFASGDPVADHEQCQWIRERIEEGDVWAWCKVKVTGRWKCFEACEYLGACGYSNEKQFKECSYYKTMQKAVVDELNRKYEMALHEFAEWEAKSMTEEQAKQILIEKITSLQGCKATELISHPDIKPLVVGFQVPQLLEELVQEKRICEVEYVLPNPSYRAKSFYLPIETEIRIRPMGH